MPQRDRERGPVKAAARLRRDEFAVLYSDSYRRLWCIAAAVLGSGTGADDAVQEAALVALRKLDEFERGTRFESWMGQIVRFVARNHARKATRRRSASARIDHEPAHNPGDSTSEGNLVIRSGGCVDADRAGFDDSLLGALNGLDEVPRMCLLLRTILDEPYSAIGRTLGIPEGTAMSHVHRARKRLREVLGEDGRTRGRTEP